MIVAQEGSLQMLSGYYMHAFEKTVNGDGPTVAVPADAQDAGHGNLRMSQDAIGIAYGWDM